MAGPRATIIDVSDVVLVTPSEPTPYHVLQLSPLDSQLFLRFTIEYLLVYPAQPDRDSKRTVACIKAALSQALVPYYPLAGRVREQNNGSNLEVLCQAQGAVFIEANGNFSLNDFDRAPPHCDQWRKLLSLQVADILRGPPLVIQLTWLTDGAAVLGVGISHCLCDGIGSTEFLNSWAELAVGRKGLADIRHKPIWDRHLLDPILPTCTTVSHPEFDQVPDICNFADRLTRESLVPTAICFDRRRLTGLKKIAASTTQWVDSGHLLSRPSKYFYTSFEVLAAHVWRCWVRAMELPARQVIRLLFSVNVRGKVEPQLPDGYYGNGFVLACAETSVKELLEKGLGWGAGLLRRAKERVNDEYVKTVVEVVRNSRARPETVGVLIVSQWSRMGLDKVDVGMGKPVHVGSISSDIYCLFLPVCEQSDAVKVTLAVPKGAVAKYEHWLRNPFY